jgi:eukaryotic-like serine/threonine-protein kinase
MRRCKSNGACGENFKSSAQADFPNSMQTRGNSTPAPSRDEFGIIVAFMKSIDNTGEFERRLDLLLASAPHERSRLLASWHVELGAAICSRLQRLIDQSAAGETASEVSANSIAANIETHLGPWRLGEPIGHGGMGSVFLAERDDGAFERRAAVKLIRFDDAKLAEQLARERRLLARLDHPHIAKLLDGGTSAMGLPYMVTEFVAGSELDIYLQERRPNFHSRMHLFLQIADAVAYAHGQLLVHCDLKPGNVLVDSDGQCKLLDFGISAALQSHGGLAKSAGFTRNYAAPEQLQGGSVDTRTDVYALGLLLRLLSAGSDQNGVAAHRFAPTSVRADAHSLTIPTQLKTDIDAIYQAATKSDPALRYASVHALTADVRAMLMAFPITARPTNFPHRVALYFRRHQRVWPWAAAGLSIMLLVAAYALIQRVQNRDQAKFAALQRQHSEDYSRFIYGVLQDLQLQGAGGEKLLNSMRKNVANYLHSSPQNAFDVTVNIASAYGEMGNFPKRAEIYAEAYNTFAAASPAIRAQAACMLAQVKAESGAKVDAKQLLQEAHELQIQVQSDWRARVNCDLAEGKAMRNLGELANSVTAFKSAVATLKIEASTAHPDYLLALTGLSASLIRAGQLQDALVVLDEADELVQKNGAQSTDQAISLQQNRAVVERRLGRLSDARVHFEEVIKLAQLRDPKTGASSLTRCNYALTLTELGQFAAAHEQFAAANLSDDKRTTPDQRYACFTYMAQLALAQKDQQALSNAVENGYANVVRSFGNADERLQILPLWPLLLADQATNAELKASQLDNRIAKIRALKITKDGPLAMALDARANLWRTSGNCARAVQLWQEAEALATRDAAQESFRVAELQIGRAQCLAKLGQLDAAIKLASVAAARIREQRGATHEKALQAAEILRQLNVASR